MVVVYDDAGGAVGHRVGEDFAGMDGAAINEADGDHPHVEHFVGAVDGGAEEMFLLAVSVVPDEGQEISRRLDLGALGFDAAARELDRRQNQRSLGGAHAFELRQVFGSHFQPLLVNEAVAQ